MSIEEIASSLSSFTVRHVLITGGEPLLQPRTPDLVRHLKTCGYDVSIETNGEVSIADVAGHARVIMDIKTPGSGVCSTEYKKNLAFLKSTDEIKFVITSETDYEWSRDIVRAGALPTGEILFSPVIYSNSSNESFTPRILAERILADKLPVRFQLQLHKLIWNEERGR